MVPTVMEAHYLSTPGGRRWLMHHAPGTAVRGCVVACAPMGEEMNKSRRMMALQARALARAGWAVVHLDLAGTGDSDGQLDTVRWSDWCDDIALAAAWIQDRHPESANVPLCLWGLRAGALLAMDALHRHPNSLGEAHLLLWQPLSQGAPQVQQWLRLGTVAGLGRHTGSPPPSMAELKAQLANRAEDSCLTLGGYRISAALLNDLQQCQPAPPPAGGTQRLLWLELQSLPEPALLPASQTRLRAWGDAGWAVTAESLSGPGFWNSVEIAECPDLLERTLQLMETVQ